MSDGERAEWVAAPWSRIALYATSGATGGGGVGMIDRKAFEKSWAEIENVIVDRMKKGQYEWAAEAVWGEAEAACRATQARLVACLGNLLAILDSKEMKGSMVSAWIHGVQVSDEISERNGAWIDEARVALTEARGAGADTAGGGGE